MPAKSMERERALKAREPRYQGEPCKYGHSGERDTKSLHCCECKAARKRNPVYAESQRQYMRERRKDPAVREAERAWKQSAAYKAQQRQYAMQRRKNDPVVQETERQRRADPEYKAWYRQWLATQKQDPELYQRYLDTKRRHKTKRAQDAATREADRVIAKAKKDAYRQTDVGRSKVNAWNASRRAARIRATPAWADQEKIEWFFRERVRLEQETGIRHHVDHIIPLQGELVCGLHVENNLQVIPAVVNIRKRNHFAA